MIRNCMNNLYAIILCGGSGTRLWPVSRTSRPKQLLKFNSEQSLLQETLLRIAKKINNKNIYLVANESYKFIIQDQLHEIDMLDHICLLLEPEGKDTLPAIAYASKMIDQINSNAIISVFPSDHKISNGNEFLNVWESSIQSANNNYLTLIGIIPTSAAVGYGYIEPSSETIYKSSGYEVRKVEKFIEKPDKTLAFQLVDRGFLWNAGMFVFKSSVFFGMLEKYQKVLYNKLFSIDQALNFEIIYKNLTPISMDNGIVELANKVAVVPGNFGWSDLGSWDSVFHELKKDSSNNASVGVSTTINSQENIIWNESGLLALSGVEGMVVVNTVDATLVCRRDNSEGVKELVSLLKDNQPEQIDTHIKVIRPWGSYTVLEHGVGFKIKRIEVNPHHKLSLQSHNKRSEHWVVVEGIAQVTSGDKTFTVQKNESTFIPINTRHRLENLSDDLLIIIEVQSGDYLEEDDIVRFNDDYGRAK